MKNKQIKILLTGMLSALVFVSVLFLPVSSVQALSVTDGEAAVNVLGQADFTSGDANRGGSVSANTLSSPRFMVLDSENNRLFVSDSSNSRVLVYDATTITDGEAAVNVLGQADFTSTSPNRGDKSGAVAANGLNIPHGLAYDSGRDRLFVSDYENNRILVYDTATITDGEAAVNVLGQADFTSNSFSVSSTGLYKPQGLSYDEVNDVLFVADTENSRVLVYDATTITDGEAAVNVLGQADFTSGDANRGGSVSASGLARQAGVYFDAVSGSLFVVGGSNRRVLVYDATTITDGEAAVNVLGQADFTSNEENWGGEVTLTPDGKGGFIESVDPSSKGFGSPPYGVLLDASSELLYVADAANSRILIFDLSGSSVEVSGGGLRYTEPPFCDAQFSPNVISQGESTTLSWEVSWPTESQNTYYVKVPGEGLYSSRVNSIEITPQHTVTYIPAVFNLWGAKFCGAKVTVLSEEGGEVQPKNPANKELSAGVSNHPFIRPILSLFSRLFIK